MHEFGNEYDKNEFYPGSLVELQSPYVLRNLRGQAVEHPGPEAAMDQVPSLPGALRLCQRQLHQGLEHPGQRLEEDCYHRQFSAGENENINSY